MPDRRWKAADVCVHRWYLLTFRAVSHLHEMPRQGAFIDGSSNASAPCPASSRSP
ncbi:MAG: hypothetical protein OXG35_07010 [Acidobacteria bacterium]|nr:hypothetical protein [Acidobacteriota bacterium]